MRKGISAVVLGALVVVSVLLVGALIYFNPPKARSGEVHFGDVTIRTADVDGDGVRDVITVETNEGAKIVVDPQEGKVESDAFVFVDTDGDGTVDTVEEKSSGRRRGIPGSGAGKESGGAEANVQEENAEEGNESVFFPFDPWCILDDPTCWDMFGGWGSDENAEEGGKPYVPPPAVDLSPVGVDWDWIPFGPPQPEEDGEVRIPVLRFGGERGVAMDVDGDGKYDIFQKGRQIFFDSGGDGEADTGYEEGDSYDVFVDFGRRRIAVDVGKDGSVNLWKEGRHLCIDLDGDGSCEAEAETDESGNLGNYRYDPARLGRFVGPGVLDKLGDPKALEEYIRDNFGDYVDAWDRVRDWEHRPPVEMPSVEFEAVSLPALTPADPSDIDRLGVLGQPYESKEEACMESINFIVDAAEHKPGADLGAFRYYLSPQLSGSDREALQRRFVALQETYWVEEPHLVGRFTRNIRVQEEQWPDVNVPGRVQFCGRIYGYWQAIMPEGNWSRPRYMYVPLKVVCDGAGKIYYLWYTSEDLACFEGR